MMDNKSGQKLPGLFGRNLFVGTVHAMKKTTALVLDRDDVKEALADFFARVTKFLQCDLNAKIPDLATIADKELIRLYGEFGLGYLLVSENPDADSVLIDLGGDNWHVAARKMEPGQVWKSWKSNQS